MSLSALLPLPSPVLAPPPGLPRVTLTGSLAGGPHGAAEAESATGAEGPAGGTENAPGVHRLRALLDGLAEFSVRAWPRQGLATVWARTDVLLQLVDPRQMARSLRQVADCRTALGDAAPPQIALLPRADAQGAHETALLQAGCCAVLPLDAPTEVLRARLSALLRLGGQAVRWRDDARTDALTGLANRRQSDFMLQRECLRASRQQQPLSLLMIDVDHFKRYNDTHGHAAGDACLRAIARVIARLAQRPTDCAARHGGEEFSLLLGDTDADGAWVVAHRLLRGIRALRLPHGAPGAGPNVTVSVGIATAADMLQPPSPDVLIESADAALYAAKRQGRDRVCHGAGPLAGEDMLAPLGSVVVRALR